MTEEDAQYLRSYAPDARIHAVPIGVDAEEFSPNAEQNRQDLTAVFVGNFNHTPNVEAARFLAHQLAPLFPQVTFAIHGTPLLPDFNSSGNVRFPGYVADTRQLYQRPNTIIVAPLFSGTGQRVKLLEAFAMACPVITTTVGAMGFPIQNGVQAMIAGTVDEFAAAMRHLIGSRERRTRLGNEGRRMILERFTWNRIAEELWGVVTKTAVSH
jgi:glycosyltransferase involved in cell wall biosynthesis